MSHSPSDIAQSLLRCKELQIPGLPDCSAYAVVDSLPSDPEALLRLPEVPKLKGVTLPVLLSLQNSANLGGTDPDFLQWLSHLHRVAELKSDDLDSALATDGENSEWPEIAIRLAILFLDWFNRSNDVRFVNTALKIFDNKRVVTHLRIDNRQSFNRANALGALAVSLLELSLSRISARGWNAAVPATPDDWFVHDVEFPASIPATKVVVFSPNRYGAYTLRVLDMLHRQGVTVAAVVVRKMMNSQRIVQEFRRDGKKLLQKVRRKVLHRGAGSTTSSGQQLAYKSVDDWGKAHGVPVVSCDTLNDSSVEQALREHMPDLVLFAGGGLIRDNILRLAGDGILNCHMGALPAYRGFNTVDWMVLNNDVQNLALTVHFMTAAVDEGDVLGVYPVQPAGASSVEEIRAAMEAEMPRAIVHALCCYRSGTLRRKQQLREHGEQYFAIHPMLQEIAERRLKRT